MIVKPLNRWQLAKQLEASAKKNAKMKAVPLNVIENKQDII